MEEGQTPLGVGVWRFCQGHGQTPLACVSACLRALTQFVCPVRLSSGSDCEGEGPPRRAGQAEMFGGSCRPEACQVVPGILLLPASPWLTTHFSALFSQQ